jgi:hypothetical protein
MERRRAFSMARWAAGLGAAALLVSTLACGGVSDGGKLRWERDPAKGLELAHFVGKPVVLYFTSDG